MWFEYVKEISPKFGTTIRPMHLRLFLSVFLVSALSLRSAWKTTQVFNNSDGGIFDSRALQDVPSDMTLVEIRSDVFPPLDRNRTCVPWSVDSDEWWTHNPDWIVAMENDTHYCFDPMPEDSPKTQLIRRIYQNQFQGNCSDVYTVRMWNSGWGADMSNVANALHHALKMKRPLQTFAQPFWHYAVLPNGTAEACGRRDQYCYFLNISQCAAREYYPETTQMARRKFIHQDIMWYTQFASRPQTWLRKQMYEFSKVSFQLTQPCSVIHVRRADVVLHGKRSRRYHAIEEYMLEEFQLDTNVLILTDDANAIPEAQAKQRPRHKGAEGGWENHIPSGNPTHEMMVLQSTFKAVQQCHKLVRSNSGIGMYIEGMMKDAGKDDFVVFNIDASQQVHDRSFHESKVISRENWTDVAINVSSAVTRS
jgi:hypothetical protein